MILQKVVLLHGHLGFASVIIPRVHMTVPDESHSRQLLEAILKDTSD